uniref:dolichyl-phosphate-mannose--protein mannosyltransferase n=1 Tax=Ascaris lumbricoides TaxID=6252 RepID=A0A0M3IP41_ASCLU
MRCLLRVLLCTFATMGMLLIRLYINGFKSPKFSSFDNPIASHPSAFFRLFSYCYLIVLNIWLLVNPSKLCFDYSMGCITPIESVFDRRFCLTISIVIVIIILLYRRIVNCLAWSRSAYQFNQFFFSLFSYCYLIVLNIWLLVNPSKLCFDYSMGCITPIESVFDRRFCLTISIVIVIIILLYRRIVNCLAWSRLTYFGFSIAILAFLPASNFFLTFFLAHFGILAFWHFRLTYLGFSIAILAFLPASNFFLTVGFVLAERVLYLPSAGFCILVAIVYDKLKTQISDHSKNEMVRFAASILAFLPASNFFLTVGFVLAERVLYLPSVGFCILVAIVYDKLKTQISDHSKNEMVRFAACIILLLGVNKSMERCSEWRTELDLYRSGLVVCPTNAKIHYNLGKVLADSGDSLTAEVSYKSAIRLNPSYDHAMNNLANIYLVRGQYSEAEKLLKKCVKIRSGFAAAWMNLGLAMLGQRKFKESEECFRMSLSIRPNYPDCLYNLGNLYLQQNKKRLAESIWRNVTRIQMDHERAWVNLLVLLDELDDCEEVIELADSALEYLDDRASIHFQLGTCFGKMAQFGNAEKHLRKAVDLQRDNALYWTNLGILYQRWNRTENAIEAYRMTLTLQPASQTAKDNLGKLAHKLN